MNAFPSDRSILTQSSSESNRTDAAAGLNLQRVVAGSGVE